MAVTTGKRTKWNMGEVRHLALAAELVRPNIFNVNLVVERCEGDFDLALEALTMSPRPAWVIELLDFKTEKK
jgi:hypothetical protein